MFKNRVTLGWLLIGLIVSGVARGQTSEAFRAPADRPVDILHIRLDLDVSLKDKSISGSATIHFSPNRDISSFTLDAVDLDVSEVREVSETGQPGKSLTFEATGKELVVRFEKPLARGEAKRIAVAYQVKEPQSGLYFFGPTEAEPETPWMVWSQGQPERNRHWFPCFDRPNERQTTELIARVDSEFTVLSNGKLAGQRPIEDGKRTEFHWKQEKPHVSYLVTLVAGKFAVVEDTWRGRPITYYVSPDREQDARRTFGNTVEMLDFFSERFGIEYPWDKYAQVVVEQFIAGGMENTSATTLYEAVMHDRRALIDSNPDWLIAHELGHQWWGDLVTCRDWSHLWLNEGFATYCEVLWQEHKRGRDERDYLLYQKSQTARTGSARERPIVDRRYRSPDTMFDTRAYPKGGWVLHMLRSRLGDADFFHGLKRYGLEYAYNTAETSDFRKTFERLYGVSLVRFFHDWTERKGHPILNVKTTDQEDGFVRIEIRQTQDDEAFHFPLKIELTKAGDGGESVTITRMIETKELSFLVPIKSRPVQVRVDPDFTLLAEIQEDKSRDYWVAQLTRAESVPERLRAVEHFAKSPSAADRELLIGCLKSDAFYGVRMAAAAALGKTKKDDVKEALPVGLDDKHAQVRRACAEALGQFEEDEKIAKVLKARHEQGDQSYFVEAAVIEALAKVLDPPPRELLISALEKESHRDVIRTKALAGLSDCGEIEALHALKTWTKPGHPQRVRTSAMNALAQSLKKHSFSEEEKTGAVDLLGSYLKEPGPRVRRAAISALMQIPELAQNEKDRIANMADYDADAYVRSAAKNALKKFEEAKANTQVEKLQTDLEKLQAQYKKLQEQIEQLQTQGK